MKRMVTDEEIIALIQKYAPGFDPASIEEGDILQDAVLGLNEDGEAVKGNLYGKYVRIIDYTGDGTNLSADMLDAIKKGVFINGTLSYLINPLFLPRNPNQTEGFVIGTRNDNRRLGIHPYTVSNNSISINVNRGLILFGQEVGISANPLTFNGYEIPTPPSDRTHKWLVIVDTDGKMKWVDPATL